MLITLGLLVTSRLPVPGQAEPTLKRLGREISVKEELLSLAFVEPIFKLPPTVVRLHKASRLVGLLPTTLTSRIVRLPPTEIKYCKLHRSVMGSPPGRSAPVAALPLPSRVRLPVMVVYRQPPGPVKPFGAVWVLMVMLPVYGPVQGVAGVQEGQPVPPSPSILKEGMPLPFAEMRFGPPLTGAVLSTSYQAGFEPIWVGSPLEAPAVGAPRPKSTAVRSR